MEDYTCFSTDSPLRRRVQNRNAQRKYRSSRNKRPDRSQGDISSSSRAAGPKVTEAGVNVGRPTHSSTVSDSPGPASPLRRSKETNDLAGLKDVTIQSSNAHSAEDIQDDDICFDMLSGDWFDQTLHDQFWLERSPVECSVDDLTNTDVQGMMKGSQNLLGEKAEAKDLHILPTGTASKTQDGMVLSSGFFDASNTYPSILNDKVTAGMESNVLANTLAVSHSDHSIETLQSGVTQNKPRAMESGNPSHIQPLQKPLLHIAAGSGNPAVVQLLVKRGLDVDQKDSMGRTALHQAMTKGDVDIARVLIRCGAHLDEPDDSGWTAIHLAAAKGFEEGVCLLLHCGANASLMAKERA